MLCTSLVSKRANPPPVKVSYHSFFSNILVKLGEKRHSTHKKATALSYQSDVGSARIRARLYKVAGYKLLQAEWCN